MNKQKQTMPEPIRLWIVDLRSGKYKQTTATLEDEDGLCCLGVACRTAQNNGIHVKEQSNNHLVGASFYDQPETFKWLNLATNNGSSFTADELSLTSLNDRENFTFLEIANYIENNWQNIVKG
jgi:hypothetical protein